MSKRGRVLVESAANFLAVSLEADFNARECMWRASREEGMSYKLIAEGLEVFGFPWSSKAVGESVREQDDLNAHRYDLQLLIEEKIKERNEHDSA